MRNIGIVSEGLLKKIEKQLQVLIKVSFNLLHVAQKYRIRPSQREDEKLIAMLDELKENEKELLTCLVEEGAW